MGKRAFKIERKTKETDISISCNLDGRGTYKIDTGMPFLNHLLIAFARYSEFDLEVYAKGDLDVDFHHTVEDIGLVLGKVIVSALGDGRGIERFGTYFIPMDEALVRVVLDISGRPFLFYNIDFKEERIGDFPVSLFIEFMRAFVNEGKFTLHIDMLRGENAHHVAEAMFKGIGKVFKIAVGINPLSKDIPSTKGVLI